MHYIFLDEDNIFKLISKSEMYKRLMQLYNQIQTKLESNNMIQIDDSYEDTIKIDFESKFPVGIEKIIEESSSIINTEYKKLNNIKKNRYNEETITMQFVTLLERLKLEKYPIHIDVVQRKIFISYASDMKTLNGIITESLNNYDSQLGSKKFFFLKPNNLEEKLVFSKAMRNLLYQINNSYDEVLIEYQELAETIQRIIFIETGLEFEVERKYD